MMKTIDERVLAGYNAGIEHGRLRTDLGLIEFERTKELLAEYLPKPPAVVYDIGGGYGEYAWHLASLGYDVHLFDISEKNIEMSNDLAAEYPGCTLKVAEVADARSINRPDESADAILFMGPLYHIVERAERILALNECHRLLRPGGKLFSAAITRYATTLWALSCYGIKNHVLEDVRFQEMILRELSDGQHIKPDNSSYKGMGRSFFHLPDELREELAESGFCKSDIRGVIGCGWMVPNLDEVWKNEAVKTIIMDIVRKTDKDASILGLSTHILAISVK
jgi:SAM-dependent methyltransferase